MFQNLTGWHAIIVLAIVLLLFGAAKLPALAKSVGQSMRILKTEITDDGRGGRATAAADDAAEPSAPPAAAVPLRVPDRDTAA